MRGMIIVGVLLAISPIANAQSLLGNGGQGGGGLIGPQGSGYGSNTNDHYVNGYTKQNGTYVQPHWQTNSNNTQRDNYGSQGNYNPHTDRYGTKPPKY